MDQQLQPTEMHTRHSSKNYGPTHTTTSTVAQYTDMQPTQMDMPGNTAENTPRVGLHSLPQLPPERPLIAIAQPRRTGFNSSQDPVAGTSTPSEARATPQRPGVSPARNMFSPVSPDAEEDRRLHCIEPIRPAPLGGRVQQLAQPLQDDFTTDDMGILNEMQHIPITPRG